MDPWTSTRGRRACIAARSDPDHQRTQYRSRFQPVSGDADSHIGRNRPVLPDCHFRAHHEIGEGRIRKPYAGNDPGGALGNFIDRILSGYVVDMFDFEFMEFAVFNIADIFITVGAFMFCVYILIAGKKDNVFAFATHKKHRFADQEPAQEFHDYSLDKILEEYSEPAKPDTGSRVGTPFSDDTGNAD
jgi:hypothetical protein